MKKTPLLENWKEHYEDIRPKFGKTLQADQTKEFWLDLTRDILTHIARFLALIYSKGKNILLWYKKRRLVAKKRPHREIVIHVKWILVGFILLWAFHPHSKVIADPVQPVKHEIPMAKKIPESKLKPQEEVTEIKTQTANASLSAVPSIVTPSGGSVQSLIIKWANHYGVSSSWMLSVAQCESSFDPSNSYLGHYGVYQFLPSTYNAYYQQAGSGSDYWNAENNIRTAIYMFSIGESHQWACA